MNARFLLAAIMVCVSAAALAQSAVYIYTPLGYQQITPVPSGTALTVPTAARVAEICVSTQAVRYRDDGTNPTTSVGIPVPSGSCFQYSGALTAIRFIQQTSPSTLDVSYYR